MSQSLALHIAPKIQTRVTDIQLVNRLEHKKKKNNNKNKNKKEENSGHFHGESLMFSCVDVFCYLSISYALMNDLIFVFLQKSTIRLTTSINLLTL